MVNVVEVPGSVLLAVAGSVVAASVVVGPVSVVGPGSVVVPVIGLVVGSTVVVEVVLEVVPVVVVVVVVVPGSELVPLLDPVSDPDGEKQAGLSNANTTQSARGATIRDIVQETAHAVKASAAILWNRKMSTPTAGCWQARIRASRTLARHSRQGMGDRVSD
ncbi:hypothetical protein [Nannocystis pusilla]|uniref:hypothetical protein n=1 Tax=Nannocystis pusilla TaxID=889268 RepID=UPI003DA60C0F